MIRGRIGCVSSGTRKTPPSRPGATPNLPPTDRPPAGGVRRYALQSPPRPSLEGPPVFRSFSLGSCGPVPVRPQPLLGTGVQFEGLSRLLAPLSFVTVTPGHAASPANHRNPVFIRHIGESRPRPAWRPGA